MTSPETRPSYKNRVLPTEPRRTDWGNTVPKITDREPTSILIKAFPPLEIHSNPTDEEDNWTCISNPEGENLPSDKFSLPDGQISIKIVAPQLSSFESNYPQQDLEDRQYHGEWYTILDVGKNIDIS